MPGDVEVMVSRADIARLAEVHRPAVANWERRHSDFPRPVGVVGGIERFRAADIVVWLESRRIPRNARSVREPEGTSYGDRFRRNLQGPTSPTPSVAARALVDQLSKPARVNVFRGALDMDQYRDLLLGLAHMAARRPAEWSGLRESLNHEDDKFIDGLQGVLGETDLGPFTSLFDAAVLNPRHIEETRTIVRLIDGESKRPFAKQAELFRHVFAGLLERFAEREGKRAGDLHTPPSVTRLAARMLDAMGGGDSVYDPFCRAGELLAAVVAESTRVRGESSRRLRVEGSHPRAATCRLAEMHLDLYDVNWEVQAGLALARPQSRAVGHDLVVSNPPFNMGVDEQMVRGHPWRYGDPSPHNANFAWLQHVLAALNDTGRAAVLVANNACFSMAAHDRKIRAAMVEDGVIACLVALPPQLFSATAVPSTLWVLDRQRRHPEEILFMDATSSGTMASRTSRVLTEDDMSELVETFTRWWCAEPGQPFDRPRARRVPLAEVRERVYSLNPLAYVEPPIRAIEVGQRVEQIHRLSAELRRLRNSAEEVGGKASVLERVEINPIGRSEPRTRKTLIGDVPYGWEQAPLGRLAEIQAGPYLQKENGVTDGVPVIHPRDLRDGWIAGDDMELTASASDALVRRYALAPGDVLCVRAGELGRHGLVGAGQGGWLFNTGLLRVRPTDDILPKYLAHYFSLPEVRNWIKRHASGTAVPSINREVLAELPIVLPPSDVQHRIGRALELAQDEVRIHDQLARTAARLRETLAPLLMTGVLPPL
ncbi:N-6 DNA methylase [Micromonospora sp. ATA32]|nr:N-6 DNA methylase [Micromonospora sp. ATA32]